MSIKNLFNKNDILQILPATTEEEISREIESEGYISSFIEEQNKFLPRVDLSNPANFARWGSAEQYYLDSIEYIAETYPYDGSLKEKVNWSLSSSYLDLYLFENEYPRVNGYVNLGLNYGTQVSSSSNYSLVDNLSYIFLKGGPNSASAGMEGKPLAETFNLSNYYSTASNRENNLEIDPNAGITIEFWMNKVSASAGSGKQVIFDLWNSRSYADTNYGRIRLEIRPQITGSQNQFFLEIRSGSSGLSAQQADTTIPIGNNLLITGSDWKQYSLTVKNSGSQMVAELWTSGVLNDTIITGSSIGAITGSMIATIGSLITSVSGTNGGLGWGKLSASLDEFRFWKVKRNAEQIGRYWFTQVGGGTNTDLANTNLGIYYKFNEGVWNSSSIDYADAKILDYSGRISNGNLVGYSLGMRSTSSAMVLAGATEREFQDPIIYLSHPRVQEFLSAKQEIGFNHDVSGSSNLYFMFPAWIREEDEKDNAFVLKKFSQIIGKSFDDLHLQIESFSKIKHPDYTETTERPYNFTSRLVNSTGLFVPELFTQAEALEALANRSEIEEFENKLYEIKSRIYENIYNNLSFINKSKGTEKSFRNLFHAFGVDDDLLKVNLYVDGETYKFENNLKFGVARKKFADFNNPDRFDATIYQFTSSQTNSRSFISNLSGTRFNGETYEIECLFPKKFERDSELYFETTFLSSSIFGGHTANTGTTQNNLGWNSPDIFNFQVYSVRESQESKNVYFQLTGTSGGSVPNLTSSVFKDVYDNSKWNLFVRIKPNGYPYASATSGSISTYTIEFIGKNYVLDVLVNSFAVSSTIPSSFLSGARRMYAGAHRQNFTGTVIDRTDVKISNLRYWVSALEDEVLDLHAKDAFNYGTINPIQNAYLSDRNLFGNDIQQIPYGQTLALYWDFSSVSSSGPSSDGNPTTYDATFEVADLSSGSAELRQSLPAIRDAVNYFYPGIGGFYPPNDTNAINQEYLQNAELMLPEVQNSSNLVSILNQDDEVFTRESKPIKHFFSVEKSFNSIISKEMLKMFGTIQAFNNLIGEPVNRYRQNYKMLEKMRSIYFSTIENKPDFDRFLEYFKWIDSSISTIVYQLIPATAIASQKIRNVVESHILERNKYWTKFPTMEFKTPTPEGGMRGINERLYPGASGTAPANGLQASNGYWWRARAERQNPAITSNNANADISRNIILSSTYSALERSFSTPYHLDVSKTPDLTSSLSPVSVANVKNSRAVSSSNDEGFVANPVENFVPLHGAYEKLGNYKEDYEIISTSGRKNQNRFFIKSGGLSVAYANSQFISGVNEFQTLNRSGSSAKNKWVFVEKFSAPGGPETNAAAGLDVEAGEYSIYNSVNERNKIVRSQLNRWSQDYNVWGGSSSISVGAQEVPGYHKINRNTSYRNELSGTSNSIVVSASRDNLFIQRPLPANDIQYSWITASLNAGITQPFGFLTEFYRATGTATSSSLTFLSQSLSSSLVSFVGIVNNLEKDLDEAGHFLSSSVSANGELLNERILNLNGPYGHSTWKQIRAGQTISGRWLNKNNFISIMDAPRDFIFIDENGKQEKVFARPGTFKDYKESPFSSKYKPMVHSLKMKDTGRDLLFVHSYANIISSFGNNEIINKLNYKNCEPQIYDKLKEIYINTDLTDETSPISKVNKIVYSEVIFPKESNTGLNRSRSRVFYSKETASFSNQSWTSTGIGSGNYAVLSNVINGADIHIFARRTFWRDDPGLRNRKRPVVFSNNPSPGGQTVYSTTLPNSMNVRDGFASSIWPFGTHWLKNGTLGDGQDDIHISGNDNFDFGELNKPYRFDIFSWYKNTVVSGTQDYYYSIYPTASISFFYPAVFLPITCSRVNAGTTLFTPNGVELTMPWRVAEESGRRPFYDTYEDFSADVRAIGKDYSQIPEFTIDGQLTYFVANQGGNFRALTNTFLGLIGGEASSSAPSTTGRFSDNFFNTFVHSDSLKRYGKVLNEHRDYGVSKIKIKASGIKKLLPYRGFYPVQRTMQLASLLSSSLIDNIRVNVNPIQNSQSYATITMMQPYFAPGIMYNTIKAGIAVDYPIIVPSTSVTAINLVHLYVSHSINAGISVVEYLTDNRLPFESLIDLKGFPVQSFVPGSTLSLGPSNILLYPEFISGNAFNADEARTINAIWNGKFNNPLYSMAMNNFLAETSKFFLKDGKYKTISSKPEKDIKGKFESGKTYLMDVVLYKQGNFAMVESHWNQDNLSYYFDDLTIPGQHFTNKSGSFSGRYFGPACKFFYREETPSEFLLTSTFDLVKDPAQAPFTPPYFYGTAKATLRYVADGTETGDDVLSKVLSRIQITCSIDGMPWLGSNTPPESTAHRHVMPITSSINLLGISKNKSVSYNLGSQNNGKFLPGSATDPETNALNTWVISPKFETPVLNVRGRPTGFFNFTTGSVPTYLYGTQSSIWTTHDGIVYNSASYGRSIWMNYAAIPTASDGIFFQIRETLDATNYSQNSPFGSLIDVMGFDTTPQRVGELPDDGEREISELLVAIPFVDYEINETNEFAETTKIIGKNFFTIKKNIWDFQKKQVDNNAPAITPDSGLGTGIINETSISEMYKILQKYVIPPEMNFLLYDDIQPFVIYPLEFSHRLSRQEVADIWQNVLPDIGLIAQKEDSEFVHNTGLVDFFHGKKLPEDIRWMVFKLKKKAAINYFATTADSSDDDRFKFDFKVGRKEPEYSFNWPYDQCSLVELAKIEVGVELSPKDLTNVANTANIQPGQEALGNNPTLQTGISKGRQLNGKLKS